MAGLRRERAECAAAKRAPATERAYSADWRDFVAWCDQARRSALPASPDTVGLYLVHLARAGRLPATVERRVASIVSKHLLAGLASPAPDGGEVREVLHGLKRKFGTAPRNAKLALSAEDLRRVLGALPEGARGVRDRAVLLLGFGGGLRRSELAALQLGDVEVLPAGLVVQLRRSKTDQEGAGREFGVHRGAKRATCPVAAVDMWIRERGHWGGPLFCRLREPGEAIAHERLSPAAIAAVVKRAVSAVGLDASQYAGHSLRAGCATAAAAAGASELAIMGRTGHRSAAMVSRYIRHGSLFAVDPLDGVL